MSTVSVENEGFPRRDALLPVYALALLEEVMERDPPVQRWTMRKMKVRKARKAALIIRVTE